MYVLVHKRKKKPALIKEVILVFPAIHSFIEYLRSARHYATSRESNGEKKQKYLPSIIGLTA